MESQRVTRCDRGLPARPKSGKGRSIRWSLLGFIHGLKGDARAGNQILMARLAKRSGVDALAAEAVSAPPHPCYSEQRQEFATWRGLSSRQIFRDGLAG
jgi:hypothetical protein